MDATIYIPKPDLKFVNNTSGHILIQADIKGSILRFQFYGTPDERIVTIDGPHILESNPDGSMKTIFTQKVTDASGTILIEKSFNSFYDSPDKYPHTTDEKLTKKPKNWSQKQWDNYQKTGALPAR